MDRSSKLVVGVLVLGMLGLGAGELALSHQLSNKTVFLTPPPTAMVASPVPSATATPSASLRPTKTVTPTFRTPTATATAVPVQQ